MELWKNKDLQPENVPYGSGKEVWWICQNGHEWKDRIVDRIKRNTSCPYCGGYRIIFGSNDLETTNPELVKEWDYTKNKGTLPKNFKAGSNKKYGGYVLKVIHLKWVFTIEQKEKLVVLIALTEKFWLDIMI